MTRDEIMALTGRELNIAVAEKVVGLALDWTHAELRGILAEPGSRECNEGRGVYMRCNGCDRHGYGNEVDWETRCALPECPDYSTDADDCRDMEMEIERRGFAMYYGQIMSRLMQDEFYKRIDAAPDRVNAAVPTLTFLLLNAPLKLRCQGALLAVMETEEKQK